MAELPKETNYWEEAEEFFSKNKENITPGTTVIFKEKIIDVKSDFDDKAFIDLVMKVNPDGETFSLIPLLYNDEFEAKNPDIKPKAISMTEYFNDDIDRSFMAQIRLGDFTEDIIRLKEHYNIPLSKQEGDYLGEILGDSLDEADISDIVPEEELVVAPDDISSIDTPTNVVDDVPVGGVREEPFFNFGDNIDIPLQINEQGNVILYRTTDSPDYLQVSDFTQKNTSDIGTLGFGQHTYFGPNIETPQAFWVASNNRGLYKYNTNIKPNEIFIGNIGDKPELAKALGIPEQYWNMNYHRFLIETKDTYRKVLTDNIETFKKYGIKALGRYGGTSGEKSFEIIPLITNEDNLGVKAVAELEPIKGIGKGGAANWKVKEVITDTPTNIAGAEVIDEVERIQRETIEKLRNANDEFVAEQIDNIMARKINEVLPFVDTSLSRAEAIGISTTGTQITTSADPTLNTFIDEIEKITGQTIDIYDKRKLRQFMYDVAKGKDNLLNDKKSFKFNLQDGVDNSKLSDPGYKIWKNWQHTGAFNISNIRDMTPNEFTAFEPPPWVYLVDGLEKSGESINFTAISDADVNIPDTPTNVVDNLITKNDLEQSIKDIAKEVKQTYEKGQTHSIFIQNLLDDLEKKGFDINNPENIKRLDNFALTNEFLNFQDLINSDEIAPVSDIPVAAKGEEGLLETYSLSNLDNNLQIIDTPTNVVDDIAQQVDVQDVRIYFNEAYNKFNEEYMPWNYFENFLINEKELSEDVAKGIIDDIKVGLTKPEFTNFPQSTFDPNLFPKAGTNFDSAVSRNMFNSTQVQRELSAKYILEDVEDYLNLSEEQSTKLANTFYEGINPRTTGTVEFYVQQQSPNRILAGDVKSGLDMTHQIPGFYTEPIGNRSLSAIRGVGSNAPINNYYKVQVNTDNLLVDIAPARFAGTQGPLVSEGDNVLGRQINKINWDTFTKETGITYEMLGPRARIIDGNKYYAGSVQDLSRNLNTFQPNRNITGTTSTLSKTNVWEALRKSGIEGFVSGPVNVQYEIVFLDPNDNLGIGKRMNIQDATVQEFQTNKAAVTQLDELVIQPKPVTELNTYNQEDLNKLGSGNQIVDQSTVTQLDETTNAFKTQSNDIIQKLPIEKEVKDKIAKNIAELQVKWSTWSGPLELLDIYETGVMLFYGVVAAAPELKSYANTLMKDMYNTMIEFSGMENYGIKKLSGSDYEPNWSYIGEQIDKAEKIMPSEMLIKTIKEGAEKAGEENLMTGFGYIPPSLDTRKKLQTTLSNPKTPEKEDTGPSTYDKIKDTIGEWWKKPIVVYDR